MMPATAAAAAMPAGQVTTSAPSAFVSMTWGWRAAVVGYLVLYELLLPGLREIISPSTTPLMGSRLALSFVYTGLVLIPFVFYRRDWGWAHPLIFPVVWRIAKDVLSGPDRLLVPFFLLTEPTETYLAHTALDGWREEEVAVAMIQSSALASLAAVSRYVGFFSRLRIPLPEIRFGTPRGVSTKMVLVVAIAALTFAALLQSRGGLVSHMISFGMGRFRALGGIGHVIVIVQLGIVATLVWYALDRKAPRNPLFWACFAYSLAVGFLLTGSRSSIVRTAALFGVVWMLQHRKVPHFRAVAVGLGAFMLFGALGMLRTSALTGRLDVSVLTEFDWRESLEAAREEAAIWEANEPGTAIVAKVPGDVPHLLGMSYVGAVFFWVPRAVWPEKPRSVGAMTVGYIYEERDVGERLEGSGIPPGSVAEAYWNFSIPGVIVIFLLIGLLDRWFADLYQRYPHPAIQIPYVLTLLLFTPTTTTLVKFLHFFVPAMAFLFWARAFATRRGRQSHAAA